MYIFFNNDVFLPPNDISLKRRKTIFYEETILKEAKFCAKHFCTVNKQDNMLKFVQYCSKRFSKRLLKKQTGHKNVKSILNMWNIVSKFYYKWDQDHMNEVQDDFNEDKAKYEFPFPIEEELTSLQKINLCSEDVNISSENMELMLDNDKSNSIMRIYK